MDRINKFLEKRPKKHIKNIKYKNKSYTITKDDLKLIRAYKSSKCLDPSIKSIPNRILKLSSQPMDPLPGKIKKDRSDYFNEKLKQYYLANPKPKVINVPVNEIKDIWEDEDIDTLKNYTQEWIYSINNPYEGRVEDLKFTKEDLESELRRVYLKYFRPRDPKSKCIRDIIPKLPNIEDMRPFPKYPSYSWNIKGKSQLFNNIRTCINGSHVIIRDLGFNKTLFDFEFDEPILKTFIVKDQTVRALASSRNQIYLIDFENKTMKSKKIIQSEDSIKDIYMDSSFIGYLTSKTVILHDVDSLEQIKILKLKGDYPNKIKIVNNKVYLCTHKGIMIESEESTEIKNLGYVIDFVEDEGSIFCINNLKRLVSVDSNFNVAGSVAQGAIGSVVKIHPIYKLLAVIFSTEIGIYKVVDGTCIPLNTIEGTFRDVDWDYELPVLYASQKNKVIMFS